MQSHVGLDSMDHLGADRGIVHVSTDVNSGEDGHYGERECETHGIYRHMVNLRHEESKEIIPMKRSGVNSERATHARYIDPRLCPRRGNTGHVASSMRYPEFRNTKCSDLGESVMSNLA